MDCSEAKELIQLYLDNELDARSTLGVRHHLETCSGCSRLLETFQKQDQLLREAARDEMTEAPHIQEKILAAICNQPSKTGGRRLSLPMLKRVAAVAVVATVAALLVLEGGILSGTNDTVYAAAVSDHTDHCTIDRLKMAVTNIDEIEKLVATYGRMKKTPDLSTFGFINPRAKVCLVNGIRTLHLVYNAEQQPLSLFLRPHGPDLNVKRLTIGHKGDYKVASVSQSGIDLLVVSSLDDKQMEAMVRALAAQL